VTPPVVLTIAGSDSGGGAGVQADLKVFAALGAYGASVLTAVTAQNTRGVSHVHQLPAETVRHQLDAVLSDLPVRAVKTGMLGTAEVAGAVAERAAAGDLPHLVVDPVLVSTSGSVLGVTAAVERLLPYAVVATPNAEEAGALLGRRVRDPEQALRAAADLGATGARCVVVTGGDLAGDAGRAVDAVWTPDGSWLLPAPRVPGRNTHGSGCSFAAAVAVRLAAGDGVAAALRAAKAYVTAAIDGARGWRLGSGHGPLDHFGWTAAHTPAGDEGSVG
jgi:hydroxymethylpyrimidine kinase/phosphomethylpyrimidine kinase